MILRIPEYYEEFSCIASRCKDSCCAGWEIDIDEDSYTYYKSIEGNFGDRLRQSMYVAEDGGARFRLKGPKRCAMLNDQNLCDLYTELGEEALCEVCTEYPRFSIYYGEVEQKGLSLSCEEVGRILFQREDPVCLVDRKMQDYYAEGEPDSEDEEEDFAYVSFLEWVQQEIFEILKDRNRTIPERMRLFLAWCVHIQEVTNRYLAKEDDGILRTCREEIVSCGVIEWIRQNTKEDSTGKRSFSYEDFLERFQVFSDMEELDEEWIHTKKEFQTLFDADHYEKLVWDYLDSPDYSAIWYEQLLVYFVFRYFMNAAYDYDVIAYAKLVLVSTFVLRDMDTVRFHRNGGHFSLFDRIDTARIYSKEVEHSEGNADDLKEMCMMEEIASVEALYRQI